MLSAVEKNTHRKRLPKVYFRSLNQWRSLLSPLSLFLFIASVPVIALANSTQELSRLTSLSNISEDEQGYIWLTGQFGLTRYDGNKLLNFSSNSTWNVPFIWTHDIEVNGSNLLITTESHYAWIFDTQTGQAQKLPVETEDDTIYSATYFDGKYYLYTIYPKNIYVFDPALSATRVLAENIEVNDFVRTNNKLYAFNSDTVFEITDSGLEVFFSGEISSVIARENLLIIATQQKIIYQNDNHPPITLAIDKLVSTMTFENGSDSFYVIFEGNEIAKYDAQLNELAHGYTATSKAKTTAALHDRSQTLWLKSSQGIIRVSASQKVNHERNYDVAINAINVVNYQGQIVIGSYGEGLDSLSQDSNISPLINNQFSKSGLMITDLLAVDDDLYITTFDGLWKFNQPTNTLSRLDFDANGSILLSLRLDNNILYVGTDSEGFYAYDLRTNSVNYRISIDSTLNSFEIIDILPLNRNIWLATADGLEIYNTITNKSMAIELTGHSKAMSLVLADEKIFVSTNGDGIYVLNQRQELLSHFAAGVNFSRMAMIDGKIWAPSKAGLYVVDPESHQISIIPGTEIYSFTSTPVLFNDAIFIGHYGGVLEVPLEKESYYNAPVVISDTMVSGQRFINFKDIDDLSSNDVITLNLAVLDYRSGVDKKFQYKINQGVWTDISGNQITLTGLSSGEYDIEIKGTNSLGQWSNQRAFAKVSVAYPWYWTTQIRIVYVVTLICLALLVAWLLYLRANSINKIHQLLESEVKNKGKKALSISRNLHLINTLLEKNNLDEAKQVIVQSIETLESNNAQKEPSSLFGNNLSVALPYLGEYLYQKYHIKVVSKIDVDESSLDYELQANIYKIIYESVTSAILNSESRVFEIHIQEFKSKLWLTINDNENSFAHFNNSITFDMAMYYVRKIAEKYNASVNTFDAQDDKGSQLVVSFPLMNLT